MPCLPNHETSSLLLIDDDGDVRRSIRLVVRRLTANIRECATGQAGVDEVMRAAPSAVLLDLGLPDMSGLDVLEAIRSSRPETPVVVISGNDTVDAAVDAMRRGAEDFITKPFLPERLLATVRNILRLAELSRRVEQLEEDGAATGGAANLVAESPAMQGVIDRARSVAMGDHSLLIEGEPGTGKKLLARAIHEWSGAPQGSFVPLAARRLHVGDLTRTLESAAQPAESYTIFLEEVGALDSEAQAEIAEVLARRDGPVVRVIASSSSSLDAQANAGRFDRDLLAKLAANRIAVPSLRDRPEDVGALASLFSMEAAACGGSVPDLSPDAFSALCRHDWRGNVSELRRVIECVVRESGDSRLDADAVARHLPAGAGHDGVVLTPFDADGRLLPLRAVERRHLEAALKACAGNLSETARLLGIGRTTLYRKIERYGLQALSSL